MTLPTLTKRLIRFSFPVVVFTKSCDESASFLTHQFIDALCLTCEQIVSKPNWTSQKKFKAKFYHNWISLNFYVLKQTIFPLFSNLKIWRFVCRVKYRGWYMQYFSQQILPSGDTIHRWLRRFKLLMQFAKFFFSFKTTFFPTSVDIKPLGVFLFFSVVPFISLGLRQYLPAIICSSGCTFDCVHFLTSRRSWRESYTRDIFSLV